MIADSNAGYCKMMLYICQRLFYMRVLPTEVSARMENASILPALLAVSLFPHAAKFLCFPIEHEQRALGDAEIGAVQLQFAALDRRAHEGKRHQVLQAAEHRGLLDPDGEIGHRLVVALGDGLAGLDEHRHPAADEVAGRQRLDIVDEGADAAALR